MNQTDAKLKAPGERALLQVRILLGITVLGLLFSGLTCYFLPGEIRALLDLVWRRSPDTIPLLGREYQLLLRVEQGLDDINQNYRFFFLGLDWLGFAHVILAVLFAGALRDPVRNRWVIQFGIISAVLVVPAAWLFGFLRGLPTIHYLIDASFGLGALIPLGLAYYLLKKVPAGETIEGT